MLALPEAKHAESPSLQCFVYAFYLHSLYQYKNIRIQ